MDTYELKEVNDDGSGYVVFHWLDGTSTGQQFHKMPVHDKGLFDVALCDLMDEVHQRVYHAPAIAVHAAVKDSVGQVNPLDDLRSAAVAMQA